MNLGAEVRKILAKRMAIIPKCAKTAVMLSSGVDSASVMFALLHAGHRPLAVSFRMEGRMSQDFSAARQRAKAFDLEFVDVVLPTDLDVLLDDLRILIVEHRLRSKVHIECSWPFLYAIKKAADRGAKFVVTGHGVDGHFGMSKRAGIHGKHSAVALEAIREETMSKPNYIQADTLREIGEKNGVKVLIPYKCD
jgi:asparagine synthetase B (glutamine-hydrolysing)